MGITTVGNDGRMADSPSGREPPTVRLPTEHGRNIEALHELAWRDLLDLLPGAMQALLDQAASQLRATAEKLGEGATVGFTGQCDSDLFLVCNGCQGDRAVIEVKGPTAKVNWGKKRYVWQTDSYRNTYRDDPTLACEHLALPSPLFIFLDARNRTRREIEEEEADGEQILDGWAVFTYGEVLSEAPFSDQPLARWLLGF